MITQFKAGFLGSARFGSGIIVARLSDGSWSAPSAIGTAGGGFGGQIGFELTDFVFILNDAAAVRAFSQQASLTLGGNVSIAAGPVGRNAEAAGAASLKGVAGVFAYSKTKGLFAGVSLEGSILIERRDANERLYNGKVTARQLLEGSIRPPPAADPLLNVLNSRIFSGNYRNDASDAMYNDIPIYDDSHDSVNWNGRNSGSGPRRSDTLHSPVADQYEYRDNPPPKRASTWADDVYDRSPTAATATRSPLTSPSSRANPSETFERMSMVRQSRSSTVGSMGSLGSSDSKPTRPTAPKPVFRPRQESLSADQARALFTFEADQDGDLGFKKGEIITIVKRTKNKEDWWTGRIGEREGIFPSNYVEVAT